MSSKVSVFIGSSLEGLPVANEFGRRLLERAGDQVSLRPWNSGTFSLGAAYLESLTKAAGESDYAVLVATADDVASLRDRTVHQARDNVIFELGLFMGKLGRWRSFLVRTDDERLRLPSDLSGVSVANFSEERVAQGDYSTLDAAVGQVLDAIEKYVDEDGGYFVLFPSLRNDPFYLELLAGIASPASRTRDVTFLVPSEAYSGPQFLQELDELRERQRGFKGGLVAPSLSGTSAKELRQRLAFFRIPLVIVDVNPYGKTALPKHVSYVGIDNWAGGVLAARYFLQQLSTVKGPRVLVLANRDQAERHEAFLAEVKGTLEVECVQCKFSALDGKNATVHAIRHGRAPFHGIFAVSDELALGAVQALAEQAPPPAHTQPLVVGFDGFPASRLLIDSGLTALKNAVVQDAYELGQQAMALLRSRAEHPARAGAKKKVVLDVKLYV